MSRDKSFETKYKKYKLKYLTLQDSFDHQTDITELNNDNFQKMLRDTKKIIDNPGKLFQDLSLNIEDGLASMTVEYQEIYKQYINIFKDYNKLQESVSRACRECSMQNNILEIFRRIEPDLKLKGIDFDLVNSYEEFLKEDFDENLDSITEFLLSNNAYMICFDDSNIDAEDIEYELDKDKTDDSKKISILDSSSKYDLDGGYKKKYKYNYSYKNPPTYKDIRKIYKFKKVIPQQVYISNEFKATMAVITMINQVFNHCETTVTDIIGDIKEKGHEIGAKIIDTSKLSTELIKKTATSTSEMYDMIYKSNTNVYSKTFEIVISTLLLPYAKTFTELEILLNNHKKIGSFKKILFSYVIPTAIVATAVLSYKYFDITRQSIIPDDFFLVGKIDTFGKIFGTNALFDKIFFGLNAMIVKKSSVYLYTMSTNFFNYDTNKLLVERTFEGSTIVLAHDKIHKQVGLGEMFNMAKALYRLYNYSSFLDMLMNNLKINDMFDTYSHKNFLENINFINPNRFSLYNKDSRETLLIKLQSDSALTTYLRDNGYDLNLLYTELNK